MYGCSVIKKDTISIFNTMVILSSIFFAACGFHLRGYAPLSDVFTQTYIYAKKDNDLIKPLQQALQSMQKVNISNDKEQASAVITIEKFTQRRNVLTVKKNTVSEYELQYRVIFNVKSKDEKLLLASQTILIERDFTFNENDVLSKEMEEQQIRKEMLDDMVQRIIGRLYSIE